MSISLDSAISTLFIRGSNTFHSNEDSIQNLIKAALENIYCPLLPGLYDQSIVESTEEETRKWTLKFKIINEDDEKIKKKLAASHFTSLMAGIHPFSKPNKFKFISDWITMLFFLDDKNEELSISDLIQFNQRNIQVLKRDSDPTEQDDPLTWAIHDLSKRIHEFAGPLTYWRKEILYKDMGDYLQSLIKELHNRDEKMIPPLVDYMSQRRDSGAGNVMFDLMLITDDIDLPGEILDHELLISLREACNNILGWLNDIVSFPKESKGECFMNNIISVIKNERNCNNQTAIREAVILHNKEMVRFLCLSATVFHDFKDFPDQTQEQVFRYVEGLGRWIGSHYAWLSETKRYLI